MTAYFAQRCQRLSKITVNELICLVTDWSGRRKWTVIFSRPEDTITSTSPDYCPAFASCSAFKFSKKSGDYEKICHLGVAVGAITENTAALEKWKRQKKYWNFEQSQPFLLLTYQ